jgi:hypothetical protein
MDFEWRRFVLTEKIDFVLEFAENASQSENPCF